MKRTEEYNGRKCCSGNVSAQRLDLAARLLNGESGHYMHTSDRGIMAALDRGRETFILHIDVWRPHLEEFEYFRVRYVPMFDDQAEHAEYLAGAFNEAARGCLEW